jgi:electron-transferring-flavoprotein dehydrogenase
MDRETLEVDVLIVGAGPAGLAAAMRLARLQQDSGTKLSVAILEKAREAGAHSLSGAVLDPSALIELIPDYRERGAPLGIEVVDDRVYYLTSGTALRFPMVPPPLRNHGHNLISLNRFVAWFATQIEGEGVDLFSGFAGQELLLDGDQVIGVRTGDRGRGRDGREKVNFEPGVNIFAKVTVLCDGVRGNLTKPLVERLSLDAGREPQQYALGIKELWEIKPDRMEPGRVVHTLGYPLGHALFGGGFIYGLDDRQVAVGLVSGLDYQDPLFDPHAAFNQFKQHPLVAQLLEGGELLGYGAKALPEGGWNAVPRPYAAGVLLAGDAAGYLDSMRLKGIHLAMRTGMLAADAAFEALADDDTSAKSLARYEAMIERSTVRRELYPIRHVHQAFSYGLVPGLLYAGLALTTGGRIPGPSSRFPGHKRIRTLEASYGAPGLTPHRHQTIGDRRLIVDKLTDIHYSGTTYDENQPVHLRVLTDACYSTCGSEYGYPCLRFCPADVYEMVDKGEAGRRLQINASNCVHCKTCDIMDPYQAITWVPPEGGGGPRYRGL